jgi:hypothetical protein
MVTGATTKVRMKVSQYIKIRNKYNLNEEEKEEEEKE